jgi:hypothetical protein
MSPDRSAAEGFLLALDPEQRFTFQTFDDNYERKEQRKKKDEEDPLAKVLHGTLAQRWDALVRLNDAGAGIFVAVNKTDLKGRSKTNITRVRAVFIDLDGEPLPEPIHVEPHIIVESSPERWHVYWLVADLPFDKFSVVQKRLALHYRSDQAVHDLPRVMRLPGFVHRKATPFLSRLVEINEFAAYTAENLIVGVPELPPKPKQTTTTITSDGDTFWTRVNSAALADRSRWVPDVFSTARYVDSTDCYRITSKDLGRNLQEDLIIGADGIMDAGREKGLTPIDCVMDFGSGRTPQDAALWLCRQIGLAPESLGYGGSAGNGREPLSVQQDRVPQQPANDVRAPVSLDEWDAGEDPGPIPPREWLLANQFCRGFISSIVAAGGAGKSALRLVQFISMALGRSLCGQHVFRRCRVLLISLEDDFWELHRRIKAALDHFGVNRVELRGWLFCATPRGVKLAELRNRTRVAGPLEQWIRVAIKRRNPDVISLDPFVKTHALEENDAGDMDFVCNLLACLAIEYNIAVDSPHHVHKGTIAPGDADSGRGSSGIRDAGRLVYTLAPMSEDEARACDIPAENRCLYIRLDCAKVNITARSGKPTWFHLVGVSIGNTTSEYPNGDTVQVVEPWEPPSAWSNLSVEDINRILDHIERGVVEDNGRPTGQRFSDAPNVGERAVWQVIQRATGKPEGQCREIVRAWLKNGLLVERPYDDPVQRKPRKGIYVDEEKRPGKPRNVDHAEIPL